MKGRTNYTTIHVVGAPLYFFSNRLRLFKGENQRHKRSKWPDFGERFREEAYQRIVNEGLSL